MQYLLMIHSDEKAMQAATPDQNGARLAAYGAYIKAMADAGREQGRPAAPSELDGDHGPGQERQDLSAERPLRRDQGAARRLLS